MVTQLNSPDNPGPGLVDLREGLWNDRPIGPASHIQLPRERISTLHGIVTDVDAKTLLSGNDLFPSDPDPRKFFELIRPVLSRHPLARHAEVRSSGTGLHLINWLEPAVELETASDQKRWDNLVRTVQRSLPSDPRAPGITILTRPVDSINSKNGAVVETLEPGQPITPDAVIAYVDELARAPFRTIALPLLGSERVDPCPACMATGSSLGVLDFAGKCYRCGTVSLEQLYSLVYPADEPVEAGVKPARSVRQSTSRPPHSSKAEHPRQP
jgi:hypothetical protein